VTPTLTVTVAPDPTVTPTPTTTCTPTPTSFVPIQADEIKTTSNNRQQGTIYWSKMEWDLPALTPTLQAQESEKIEQKEINSENFIRITDNTPSVSNNKNKLSYFKKID
jgi:hypothetical protein